jgi:hypothetical protein
MTARGAAFAHAPEEKRMKTIKPAVIAFVLLATTVNGHAAEPCALLDDLTALQTAAVQQRLMVSAFVCNETSSYNAFVLGHQRELQKSDEDLQSFFLRQNMASGIDDYHAYKTRLANAYSLVSAQHKEEYCRLTHTALERSQRGEPNSLREFILAQPLVLVAASRSCGDPVTGEIFATPAISRSTQSRQSPGASWDGRSYDYGRRGISRGGDYYFYDGRSLRYNPYTDFFWRR